ncbi:MAG: Bro-N domain-containing protein [Pseudomonadota bacterium]
MNTNVIPMFSFDGQQLRGVKIDGEPWFVAADICRILGLSNPTMALRVLDADERSLNSIEGRPTNYVSRPGLFKLIQRSRRPEAHEFDRWVWHDVLAHPTNPP